MALAFGLLLMIWTFWVVIVGPLMVLAVILARRVR